MYLTADMTKALVCSVNSPSGSWSFLQKLFGDPDEYAYKFGNRTFASTLPIHMNWLYIQKYDFFHSVTMDYDAQKVFYGNNFRERLEFGQFLYNNRTNSYYYLAVPETNQVTMTRILVTCRAYNVIIVVIIMIIISELQF